MRGVLEAPPRVPQKHSNLQEQRLWKNNPIVGQQHKNKSLQYSSSLVVGILVRSNGSLRNQPSLPLWDKYFDGHILVAQSAVMFLLSSCPANQTAIAVLCVCWSYRRQVNTGNLSIEAAVRRPGQTDGFRLAMIGTKKQQIVISPLNTKIVRKNNKDTTLPQGYGLVLFGNGEVSGWHGTFRNSD